MGSSSQGFTQGGGGKKLVNEKMGVFDMLGIMRENPWKAGIEQKERRLEEKQQKMGLQNQILQTIVDSQKNNNKINTKMKFINIELLKSETKDDIKINEEDVITIQVTNNNNNNNNKISQKIEDNILPEEKAEKSEIREPVTQIVDVKVKKEEKKKEHIRGEVSNKRLLEVVEAKAGCWNRQLFILNPDLELTSTIKQTFEAHGCEVQVGGVERDLAHLYVLLDRKVSIKRLRRLMERGKKFGLEFFLTKTGLTSSLLARNLGRIFHKP